MDGHKIGPLLNSALQKVEAATDDEEAELLASFVGGEEAGIRLPVVVKMRGIQPEREERWEQYRDRTKEYLEPMQSRFEEVMGLRTTPLIAANALQANVLRDQIGMLSREDEIEILELDPLLKLVQMDDVVEDVSLNHFYSGNPGVYGSGVRVAVLDSGIDTSQPFLNVVDSIDTCGESVDIPGSHGTHCAGSIASTDSIYPGIAPRVELLNIKVLRSNGTGRHTYITKGIDEALDRNAHVISMSLGFNQLPTWSNGGHGWSCSAGRCPLCTAVNNASSFDEVVVVVAAGNEHMLAEALRSHGYGATFDTELCCPGQAREAITVGALTKKNFLPASFSSNGPTAYGEPKPDLSAPGVNITSTIPVPRDVNGNVIPNSPRSTLFGRKSGTSMATPVVAGAVALIVQKCMQSGVQWSPAYIRNELLNNGIVGLQEPPNVVGSGRLDLSSL